MQGKKRQFIFGLIGLGCGMILSGIFNLLILLNTTEYKNGITLNAKQMIQEELKTESNLEEKEAPVKGARPNKLVVDQNEVMPQQNEFTAETQKNDGLEKEAGGEESLITITIPEKQNATQICELLQAEGVIEDAKDFRDYISEKKMTTKLKEGTIIFRKNMSYNELLDNLMID